MSPSEYWTSEATTPLTHIPQSPGSESECHEVGVQKSWYRIHNQRSHLDLHHQHISVGSRTITGSNVSLLTVISGLKPSRSLCPVLSSNLSRVLWRSLRCFSFFLASDNGRSRQTQESQIKTVSRRRDSQGA
jgi:hypothetical protein